MCVIFQTPGITLNYPIICKKDQIFNNVDYLVCRRNTPLPNGYKFTILPLSSLSTAQKQSHAFPPIYVLISDSISIRQIVISGDIY